MATARRSGTNEGVATYGDSSRDFQVGEMTTWEQATDVELTTGLEQVEVSNVTGDRFLTGELLDFSSSSATATFMGISRDSATMWYLVLTGTPTTADTITSNGASSASADIDTITSTSTGMTAVLDCYDDAASFDDFVSPAGATTSTSFFRIIQAASGEGHDGTAATGFTASAEGTVTATTLYDNQLVAPTNGYVKQWPLGREPVVEVSEALRIRVLAPVDVDCECYVEVEVA